MSVTISTHNGSSVSREHNIRNRNVTDKESHIDPNGKHEVWHDEKIRHAYTRLFGEAVERYNAKQKRSDRRIADYLADVRNDKKKHPAYEMIVTIGNRRNRIDDNTGYDIMRKFVQTWKRRNPNLELIGAYYHADEKGAPHVHIDYIPVAHGYKKGMDTQNGLVKAFEEMGITGTAKETAQMQWEARENAFLEMLCREYGIEVKHPCEGLEHLDTDIYQAQKDLETLEEQLFRAEAELCCVQSACETEKDRLEAHIASKTAQIEKLDELCLEAEKRLKMANTSLEEVLKQSQVIENGVRASLDMQELLDKMRPLAEVLDDEYSRTAIAKADDRNKTLRERIADADKTVKQYRQISHGSAVKKNIKGHDRD